MEGEKRGRRTEEHESWEVGRTSEEEEEEEDRRNEIEERDVTDGGPAANLIQRDSDGGPDGRTGDAHGEREREAWRFRRVWFVGLKEEAAVT